MSYIVTEMTNNNNDNHLTFGDLHPGDVFILLDSDEVSVDSALFKKDVYISNIDNVTILICGAIHQVGRKVSVDANRRVAKVTGLDVQLSVTVERNKKS